MALPKSGTRIKRRTLAGMEAMWTKMWDPPKASPTTPELVAPTNPVPAFVASTLGADVTTPNTVQVDLMHGDRLTMWDGKQVDFYTISNPDLPGAFSAGFWPGPTIRVPRGAVFHGQTKGHGPPPHTIHWHGLEPTPMNDGVGHCSMELGDYTYQLQPNFIGTYFYHCHRNTVQHFEFGLYGMFLVEPPDAYDPSIPNVAGELTKNVGGYPRRTAANLSKFSQFTTYVGGDPTWGVAGPLDGILGNPDPHAFTVAYDVEALWVLDDRDSTWSDIASNPRAFYPGGANTNGGPNGGDPPAVPVARPVLRPGVDDDFAHGFFHDFNADYWFVTGVPVRPDGNTRANKTGTLDPSLLPAGVLDANGHIAPQLNSGVAGMQVPIDARVDQTILVRVLNGAYNGIEISFPMDVVIIAFDGRALGVPPFARYNEAFVLKANEPMKLSTARRFDALIKSDREFHGNATVKFFDTRGQNVPGIAAEPLMTARIPININNS